MSEETPQEELQTSEYTMEEGVTIKQEYAAQEEETVQDAEMPSAVDAAIEEAVTNEGEPAQTEEGGEAQEAKPKKVSDPNKAKPKYLKNVLNMPTSFLFKMFRMFFKVNDDVSKIPTHGMMALHNLRCNSKPRLDLVRFLKELESRGKAMSLKNFPELKDYAFKHAKQEMLSDQVRLIQASGVHFHDGKKEVIRIFEEYGTVLDLYCVGIKHPLDTVVVAMDSLESCQNAIEMLHDKDIPGLPKQVELFDLHLSMEEKEAAMAEENENYQTRWTELNRILTGVLDFKSQTKKLNLFDELLEKKIGQKEDGEFDLKAIVQALFEDTSVYVCEESLEHEAWDDDEEFLRKVKKRNDVFKAHHFLKARVNIQEDSVNADVLRLLEEKFDKGEDLSEENAIKMLFYSLPEINIVTKFRTQYELPDVSLYWILVQNLPESITEEELTNHLKDQGEVTKLILLNSNTTQVCAVIKAGGHKHLYSLCRHLRTVPLSETAEPVNIMRYTGKLASKTHDYNKNDVQVLDPIDVPKRDRKRSQGDRRGRDDDDDDEGGYRQRQRDNPGSGRHIFGVGHRKLLEREIDLLHLPSGTTKEQVMVSFAEFGKVDNVDMSKSGKSCIIRMKTVQQAIRAVEEYDGKMLPGCTQPMEACLRCDRNQGSVRNDQREFRNRDRGDRPRDRDRDRGEKRRGWGRDRDFGRPPMKQSRGFRNRRDDFDNYGGYDDYDDWNQGGGYDSYGHGGGGGRGGRRGGGRFGGGGGYGAGGFGGGGGYGGGGGFGGNQGGGGFQQEPQDDDPTNQSPEAIAKRVEDLKRQQQQLESLLQNKGGAGGGAGGSGGGPTQAAPNLMSQAPPPPPPPVTPLLGSGNNDNNPNNNYNQGYNMGQGYGGGGNNGAGAGAGDGNAAQNYNQQNYLPSYNTQGYNMQGGGNNQGQNYVSYPGAGYGYNSGYNYSQ